MRRALRAVLRLVSMRRSRARRLRLLEEIKPLRGRRLLELVARADMELHPVERRDWV